MYRGCKELADTHKLKGNSFYGKMIENKQKHKNTSYTQNVDVVNSDIRSPFFEDMDKINETYEITKNKRSVEIKTPYQCGIAVYQLSKLQMLVFYYDFLDYYFDRSDFELIYSDTDSYYIAFSDENFDNLVKPELRDEYFREGKQKFLSTSKYHDRTPGLFKKEFEGIRMIALSPKCYYADDGKGKTKFSAKGTIQRQNDMTWNRYYEALNGKIDKVKNTGFRVNKNEIVTYTQDKLGLNAYYDKRRVEEDGIHTKPLY